MKHNVSEMLILCIGDSKLIGDSLGPLIGSFLERNKSDIGNNVKVLGTLEKPIGYNDLIEISKHINYNKEYYTTIITIDSALGSNQNIGKIYDDIKQNIQELENVSTNLVENMACKIIFKILNLFKV